MTAATPKFAPGLVPESAYTPEIVADIEKDLANEQLWAGIDATQLKEKEFPQKFKLFRVNLRKVGIFKVVRDKPTVCMKVVKVYAGNDGRLSRVYEVVIANNYEYLPMKVLFSSMHGRGEKAEIAKDLKHGMTLYGFRLTADLERRFGMNQAQYDAYVLQEIDNYCWEREAGRAFFTATPFPSCLTNYINTVRADVKKTMRGSSDAVRKASADNPVALDAEVRAKIGEGFWMSFDEHSDILFKRTGIHGPTITVRSNVWREPKAGEPIKPINDLYPWLEETLSHPNPDYVALAQEIKANYPARIYCEMKVREWAWGPDPTSPTGRSRQLVKRHPFDRLVNVDAVVVANGTHTTYTNGLYCGITSNLSDVDTLVATEFKPWKSERPESYPEEEDPGLQPLPPAPAPSSSSDYDEYAADYDDDAHSAQSHEDRKRAADASGPAAKRSHH